MIKTYLARDLELNKLRNAYLISADDSPKALNQVTDFLSKAFYQNQEVLTHPDFMLVQKHEGNIKNISVDQIRDLQSFLYKTSVISGQKTAVIYNAELMNINASNSCLKLLEDTPSNTYIFLITSHLASIIPTIRSRCTKLHFLNPAKEELPAKEGVFVEKSQHKTETGSDYIGSLELENAYFKSKAVDDYYVIPFLQDTNIEKHLEYLKDFGNKDRTLWIEFTTNLQILIVRIFQKLEGQNLALSDLEKRILKQVCFKRKLLDVYDRVVKLTNDTITFDLDLRASYLLLTKIMSELISL